MAIKLKYTDKRFGNIDNAYCKLIHIHGNPEQIYYSMQIYKDKTKSDEDTAERGNGKLSDLHLDVINDSFEPDVNKPLFEQCYDDFKIKYNDLYLADV